MIVKADFVQWWNAVRDFRAVEDRLHALEKERAKLWALRAECTAECSRLYRAGFNTKAEELGLS